MGNNISGSVTPSRTELIIVGAGVIGLAHAFEAVQRGYSVRVIDRDVAPNGASVRNFGYCTISTQTGQLLETALESRKGWLAAAAKVGFWAPESGAYAVARSTAEMTILEELNSKRGTEAVSLMTADAVRSALGGAPDPAIVGGAHLTEDPRVDPRTVLTELAAWLSVQGVLFNWGTAVKDVADGTVSTGRGDFHADKVLVCVGHDLDHLFPSVWDKHRMQRCGLQMALAKSPASYTTDAAILTGTSLARYDAFTEMPGADTLKAEIESARPDLIGMGANLLLGRRPDGSLFVGDTHAYGQTMPPFQNETWSRTIIAEAEKLLGAPLDITERWQGVYLTSAQAVPVSENVDSRTRVVTDAGGIGMTLSFGLAAQTMAGL